MGHQAWAYDFEGPTRSTPLVEAKGTSGLLVMNSDIVNRMKGDPFEMKH